jgi:hypothetical protein
MKILMGGFSAKVGREDIFKPVISNESLNEACNDRGVRVNFATSKNPLFKSTTFQHQDIHKHTWTSPDGVTHNQIHHVLTEGDIQTYYMSDSSEELTVILTTTW